MDLNGNLKNKNLIAISGKKQSGKNAIAKIINQLTNNKYEEKCFADKLKDIVCLLINCTRDQLEDESFKSKKLGEEWWKIKSTMIHNDKFKTKDIIYYDYKHLSFLNDTITNLDKTQFISMNIEVIKTTPRLLLQLLGTECGRNIISPNLWVNALFTDYKASETHKVPRYYDEVNKKGLAGYEGIWEYPNWIITDMRFLNEMEAVKKRRGITIRVNRNLEESKDQHESETELDNAEFDYVIDNNSDIQSLIEKVREILIQEKLI